MALKGHTASGHSVAISADGKRIVSGSNDKTVKVWDADKGTETLTSEEHPPAAVLHGAQSLC